MLRQMTFKTAISLIAFQVGWFATVLGAAHERAWLGLVVVPAILALHLFLSKDWRRELALAVAVGLLGFVVDSALVSTAVFAPIPFVWASPPWSPPWMAMLWVNQAVALNASLAWMRGRYLLGALLGAIGGPLAYLSGAKLGAMLRLPSHHGLLIIGITWAVAFPVLQALAAKAAGPVPPANPPREP